MPFSIVNRPECSGAFSMFGVRLEDATRSLTLGSDYTTHFWNLIKFQLHSTTFKLIQNKHLFFFCTVYDRTYHKKIVDCVSNVEIFIRLFPLKQRTIYGYNVVLPICNLYFTIHSKKTCPDWHFLLGFAMGHFHTISWNSVFLYQCWAITVQPNTYPETALIWLSTFSTLYIKFGALDLSLGGATSAFKHQIHIWDIDIKISIFFIITDLITMLNLKTCNIKCQCCHIDNQCQCCHIGRKCCN